MTIEQAIEYAERAHKESHNGLQYALKRGETKFAERCKKDAEEYGQLAELLRELQERRKTDTCEGCKHRTGGDRFWICPKCRRQYDDKYEVERRNDGT